LSISDHKVPGFIYYPTELIPNGTRDWSRLLFLQACERLRIPIGRWPQFEEGITLAIDLKHIAKFAPFCPPEYNELRDTPSGWQARADRLFREHCEQALERVQARIHYDVEIGILTKIPQPREKSTSLEMRYEWAARRYCFNEPYKDMATDEHSPDKIRKSVNTIFREAEVPKRNRK